MKRALYFGCLGSLGHFIHDKGKRSTWTNKIGDGFPWEVGHMDSGLLKNGRHRDVYDGKVWWTCGGRLALWYAFVWWDTSVDTRGASNSGFYVLGFGPEVLTPESARAAAPLAFEYAGTVFPDVIRRQRHPLVLQP